MSNLGCIPDVPDRRDFRYKMPESFIAKLQEEALPPRYWLNLNLPMLNQGSLGSCVAHGVRTGFLANAIKEAGLSVAHIFSPSRLFLYYSARSIEHTREIDNGCQIRNGIKVAAQVGLADELIWPYSIPDFTTHPTHEAYRSAFQPGHHVSEYHRLENDIFEVKSAIMHGLPVIIGFAVYTSFYNLGGDGRMPEPSGSMEGGHCVTVEGWDDNSQQFTVRNSWGAHWGSSGFFYMPYDFLTSEDVFDLWVITK